MISKTDIKLQYQKVVGGSLDSIKRLTENNSGPLQNYIDWLEEKLVSK